MSNFSITNSSSPSGSNSKYSQIHNRIDILEQELNKKIESAQTSFLTAFGILASIITFISVEIQIFKSICSIDRSLWITFIILWWLLLFCVIIRSLLLSEINLKKDYIFWIVTALGLLLLWWGRYQINFSDHSEYWCVEKELNSKFDKLKLQMKEEITTLKEGLLSWRSIDPINN